MIGSGSGRHFVGAGSEAWRRGECVTVQTVGGRMEAKPGVARRSGVGQIADLRGGERQGAESIAVVHRRAPGRRERLRGVAVAVEGERGSAAGVVGRAQSADLEG